MAEPTAASPSPGSSDTIPPSSPNDLDQGEDQHSSSSSSAGTGNSPANPDDFIASSSGSGHDTPPPPEQKSFDIPSSGTGGSSKRRMPVDVDRHTGGMGGPTGAPSSSGSSSSQMKFQFYTPSTASIADSRESSLDNTNATSTSNSNNSRFNNNSNTNSMVMMGGDQIIGGGGLSTNTTTTKMKGIDPPEKELPTTTTSTQQQHQHHGALSATMAAEKARSRLIALQHQHRESRTGSSSGGGVSLSSSVNVTTGGGSGSMNMNMKQPQIIDGPSSSSDTTISTSNNNSSNITTRRRSRGSSYDNLLESIEQEEESSDDGGLGQSGSGDRRLSKSERDIDGDEDDGYAVNMDPIESDDEPLSDHCFQDVTDEGARPGGHDAGLKHNQQLSQSSGIHEHGGQSQQQQHRMPRYRSPSNNSSHQGKGNNSGSSSNMSYMMKHPSSAPQRPSHRLPPQQLMQFLHAGGRGSFGRQGGGGGGRGGGGGGMGGIFPLPLNNNNPPQSKQQQQQLQLQQMGRGQPQQQLPPQQAYLPRQGRKTHPSHQHAHASSGAHHSQSMTHGSAAHKKMYQQQQQQTTRRKSDDPISHLHSEGVDILKQAASTAHERDELDTLNDGINYLRSLESLELGGDTASGSGGGGGGNINANSMHSPRKVGGGQHNTHPSTHSSSGVNVGHHPPPPPPSAAHVQRGHRPPPKQQQGSGGGNNNKPRSKSSDAMASFLGLDDGDIITNEGLNDVDFSQSMNHLNPPQQLQQQHCPPGQQQQQQQQPGHHQRVQHRPPPPRNKHSSHSTPNTPVQVRGKRTINVAAAVDYVMNAGNPNIRLPVVVAPPPPFEQQQQQQNSAVGADGSSSSEQRGGNANNHQAHNNLVEASSADSDVNKMNNFLNAMMSEDGEEAIAVGNMNMEGLATTATTTTRPSNLKGSKQMSSFDSDHDDDSSSIGDDNEGDDTLLDDDDFENNTSMSMHAEAKFGTTSQVGSQGTLSKYAEDKQGVGMMMGEGEMGNSPRRTMGARANSMNQPEVTSSLNDIDDDDDDDMDSVNDPPMEEDDLHQNSSEGISPSVLPMRTMDERLYGVETVIPTPTRYDHHDDYADEVDSFDQAMPRLGPHGTEGGGRSSSLLGPRSNRPGGTTGVVLDSPPEGGNKKNYHRASMTDSSSKEDESRRSSDRDHRHHQQQHQQNPESPIDGQSGGDLDKYSWSGEMGSPIDSGGDRQSTHLMMKLCSHLLPVGLCDHHSFASLLQENKSNLVWDDEDPDEPGYIMHQLTNSQLINVENAFEKMVNSFERQSEKSVRNGLNDKNFERDLEEAEMILDQEEKRYESEVKANASLREVDSKSTDGSSSQINREENDVVRESVPDFPGIYPPGKGKQGEMECFYLPVITKSQKTGFESTKDLVLKPGSVFANNYLVQSELGSAAFSTAYRCLDLSSEEDEDGYQDEVCLKVIKNTKDYFDQSLDEIKILQLLKDTNRVEENNILEMRSFFYHREHLVIVTELLRQNLYEFGKSILESRGPLYFTRLRLSHITRQCLVSLKFVHELGLMHCDIKPENILLSSYSRALVKVIDFGSSSFVTDRQSSYIQSRSYRAPEVILGLPYGGKIDMWSLGCVIAELYTNEVTFQNDSELSMLSRIEAICGPFPRHMIAKGRNSHRICTDSGLIYEKVSSEDDQDEDRSHNSSSDEDSDKMVYNVYQPKMTTMAARLGFDEDFMDQPKLNEDDEKRALFVDFVSKLLTIDPDVRLSAAEALKHPWITSSLDLTEDDIRYGQ